MAPQPVRAAPVNGAEDALSVSQVNQAVAAALERSFPGAFWVTGEVQGYDRDAAKAGQRRWGQVYFELIEKEPGSDTVRAGAKALLWGDVHNAVRAKLAAASKDLRLQDGLQVKLLCKLDFYWPRASLQLRVLDVDPHFTLGDMERARRELIEKLKETGLFDRNRAAPFPRLPLNIGLVTSDGSAAYHDFIEELRASGYAFRVRFVDARMQGAETELDVPRALAVLSRDDSVDVIVVVRGGGSRSDLIWFDKEKIARAVAGCPKPVVTGIGHEIDLSVADLVAHDSRKTPTAAARLLIEGVQAFETGVSEAVRNLRENLQERVDRERRDLAEAARAWRERAVGALSRAGEGLSLAREGVRAGARRHLTVSRERLRPVPPGIGRAVRDLLAKSGERLAAFRKECEFKDPRRLLARGYSLVYAGGRLAKSVRDVRVGEFIEARLKDGLVTANVLAARKEK